MRTKKVFLVINVMFFLFTAGKVFSGHISGNSITYEYVAANQYLITMKFYRDCQGPPVQTFVTVCYQSATAGLTGNVQLDTLPGTGIEIQPGACVLSGLSTCQAGTNFGIQEWIYQGMVTLPQAANDWIFSYTDCCRSVLISTIQLSGSFIYTKLDNLNFPNNNSPQFITPPFKQYCLNSFSTFSFTCIDPDGDSLVYELDNPFSDGGGGCPSIAPVSVIYYAPYSATNPVSSSTPFLFDSTNGTLAFTPDVIQSGVIGMSVKEYRNGLVIGEVRREDQIIVINGILYSNFMNGKVFNDNNNNQIYDAGDQNKHGTIIEAQPGPIYASTNFLGNYSLPCIFGTYTSSIPNIPLYYVSAPSTNSSTFNSPFQTDSLNDFALGAPYNVQDLQVVLTGNAGPVPGVNSSLHVTYINAGTAVISGTVSLVYDTNYVYLSSTVSPNNLSGNILTWNFSNLSPLSSVDMDIFFNLPIVVPLGTQLLSYSEILPLSNDSAIYDNSDTLHQLVSASYDPNEKIVEPSGTISSAMIANGLYLEYTIFFQNTGTAPAINVFIADTLDQKLNIPTFEVLSASHPYTWNIRGTGIIEFRFDTILLPDSNSNELLSHGFIKYRIKPKNSLVTGDKITNTAYIYFDNNPAVVTNSTSTTIVNTTTSVVQLPTKISDLLVYPNPSSSQLTIEMNLKEPSLVKIQLYNMFGSLVKNIENSLQSGAYKKQVSLTTFSKGLYFLKLSNMEDYTVVKVVIE